MFHYLPSDEWLERNDMFTKYTDVVTDLLNIRNAFQFHCSKIKSNDTGRRGDFLFVPNVKFCCLLVPRVSRHESSYKRSNVPVLNLYYNEYLLK